MKTKCFLIGAFALFAGLSFVSCSDDDKPEVPVFPKVEEIKAGPNETHEISFTANLDWRIDIERGGDWLVFVDEDGIELGKFDKGLAGDIKKTLKIKDNAWGFGDVDADIVLTMGSDNKKQTIYKVIRTGKERIVKLFVGNNVAEKVELIYQNGGSTKATIGFIANYDWVISLPEALEINKETLTADAAEYAEGDKPTTTARISMKAGFVASAYTGDIEICDLNGDYVHKIPVVYTGMGENDFSINVNNRFNQWQGIKFTEEGNFIEQRGSIENPTADKEVSFFVLAKDLKYKSYLIKMDDQNKPVEIKATDAACWVTLEDKDGTIKVGSKGANTDAPRELFLLFLPEKVAAGAVIADYFLDGAVSDKGANNVIKISQKGVVVAQGFNLQWGLKGAIDGGNITDGSGLIGIVGNGAPANNTYMFSVTNAMLEDAGALQIFPNGWQAGPSIGFSYDVVAIEGDWSGVAKELVQQAGVFGISLNQLDTVGSGLAVVLFYNSSADKTAGKPMAALILMKD